MIKEIVIELETMLNPTSNSFNLKQRYTQFNNHLLIHRANLCIEGYGKVWSGDLDFTSEEKKLKKLCKKYNIQIFILKEEDGRFINKKNVPLEKSIIKISGTSTIIREDIGLLYKRDPKGKWKLSNEYNFLFPKK